MVSTLRLWRLCRTEFTARAFTGEGAFRYGGRWSPRGVAVVYCAESRSLAAMEILVHQLGTEIFKQSQWSLIAADVPVGLIEKPARVPTDWRELPPLAEVQGFGAQWAQASRSAALRVPSSVVLGEFNYLLNPAHTDFARITIHPPEHFEFDPRLKR